MVSICAAAGKASAEPLAPRWHHALTIRHHHGPPRYAEPLVVPLYPTGVVFQTPFSVVPGPDGPVIVRIPHYRGPDGAYDDAGDLTNDIQGTPCGQECTARSLVRWGYLPER